MGCGLFRGLDSLPAHTSEHARPRLPALGERRSIPVENIVTATTFGRRVAELRLEREWQGTQVKTVAGLRGLVSQDPSVFMPTVNYIDPSAVAAAGVTDAGRTGRPPRGEP